MEENQLIQVFKERTDQTLPAWLSELPVQVLDCDQRPNDWHLVIGRDQLELAHPQQPTMQLSTQSVTRRLKQKEATELIKACSASRGQRILDGFGGWGVDGLTMALNGADVTICEINPLVHGLQLDLSRRLNFPAHHRHSDVRELLQSVDVSFDIVYLDPMFPAHPTGAKSRRELEVLSQLSGESSTLEVFELAMDVATSRVVVKQRRKDSTVEPPKASWSITGKTIRFDVYQRKN